MAEPVSAGLLLKAAGPVASGIAGFQRAQAEKQNAKINAFIGRTRAIQTDTVARQDLSDDLGSIRAVMGANGQTPGVGTFEVMQELRGIRDRERRVEVGSRMAESFDFGRQARNAGRAGIGALFGGMVRAGPSIFDYAQYQRSRNGSP